MGEFLVVRSYYTIVAIGIMLNTELTILAIHRKALGLWVFFVPPWLWGCLQLCAPSSTLQQPTSLCHANHLYTLPWFHCTHTIRCHLPRFLLRCPSSDSSHTHPHDISTATHTPSPSPVLYCALLAIRTHLLTVHHPPRAHTTANWLLVHVHGPSLSYIELVLSLEGHPCTIMHSLPPSSSRVIPSMPH